MNIIITILSILYILFLPGFFLSFVFFKPKQIDVIERLALSFALSIAIVPLVVFYTNLLGVKITSVSVILQVCGILFITLIILAIRHWREKA